MNSVVSWEVTRFPNALSASHKTTLNSLVIREKNAATRGGQGSEGRTGLNSVISVLQIVVLSIAFSYMIGVDGLISIHILVVLLCCCVVVEQQ